MMSMPLMLLHFSRAAGVTPGEFAGNPAKVKLLVEYVTVTLPVAVYSAEQVGAFRSFARMVNRYHFSFHPGHTPFPRFNNQRFRAQYCAFARTLPGSHHPLRQHKSLTLRVAQRGSVTVQSFAYPLSPSENLTVIQQMFCLRCARTSEKGLSL
jgi:hypothetical protein